MADQGAITVKPATADRWDDFAALMGKRGGAGGCWCMLWRQSRAQCDANKGEPNRLAMKALFDSGAVPGLLAYDGDEPVGWCSLAPRSDFPRLAASRILAPIDDQAVWSITCFVIKKTHRRRGVSVALLNAAAGQMARRGGAVIEGYPVEPNKPGYPVIYAWTGFAAAFRQAGFEECARRSDTRPIMRRRL